jgi:hypothetical protein
VEILWPALGIGAIVCVLFYALAAQWRRILRRQSWTLRALAERVRDLEEINDPQFRQRLADSSPLPLEQVLTFSFSLSARFWRETLGLSDHDWQGVLKHARFVGSVKLERWRSHTVATVAEVLPTSQSALWQTRSLDFYPQEGGQGALTLWQLQLSPPNGSAARSSSLELILRKEGIELCAELWSANTPDVKDPESTQKMRFFSVPLDLSALEDFRSQEPVIMIDDEENPGSSRRDALTSSWLSFYCAQDDLLGFEWQLWARDLARKADWERSKILDAVDFRRA